jgi:3-deoxy-manno-octulosonate cytidylyltransferase (CMP-KDO synthetase)
VGGSASEERLLLDDVLRLLRQPVPSQTASAPALRPPPVAKPRRAVAIIPARYASTRFPGKPLAPLAGKPMIQHVWERCQDSGAFAEVLVATDDARIADAVHAFGGMAVMTSPHAKTGTDRLAEVAKTREDITHVINVQGDEPLVHREMLQALSAAFEDPEVRMATLVRPLSEDERANPNVVKVAMGRNMDALYFSRADIPYERDPAHGFPHRYAHLGLYAYDRETLLALSRLPPSPLEETEKLEQLRALECGIPIRCLMTLHSTVAVDTPQDAQRVEGLMAAARAQPVA